MDVLLAGSPRRLAAGLAICACLLATLVAAASAGAHEPDPSPPPVFPVGEEGYTVSAQQAFKTAKLVPEVDRYTREKGRLTTAMEAKPPDKWQVGFFADGKEVVQVVIDSHTGAIKERWTGDQVAWQMARGYSGAFAHALNRTYVWIPLAIAFLLGLADWRRPFRMAHLDLLVLLSFGLSNIFFTQGKIGVSVPLYYPPLIYLLARMAWLGFRGRGQPLRPSAPTVVLTVATIFLIAFRVALNIADSGVIDVGYAGVVGADKATHAKPIYGEHSFPEDNPTGDTYGPFNYYAYVPFELVLPFHGTWDELPPAHAASVAFDLAVIAGLLVLGLRFGGGRTAGRRLGVILAFAWCAYPYSDYALQSNSNDSLIAALVVWALVFVASPVKRGAAIGVAGIAKFASYVLAPLFVVGQEGLGSRLRRWRGGDGWRALTPVLVASLAVLGVTALLLAPTAIDPGLSVFYERTLKSQINRVSPFSIWGQVDGIGGLQRAVMIGACLLGLAVAFVPRRRSVPQLAALAAAVTIALEISLQHWFYLYIPWFAGLVFAALLLPERGDAALEERATG